MRRKCIPFVALAGGLVAVVAAAQAPSKSTFPAKPIRLVVTFPPGGASDTVARIVAVPLSDRLGQPVVVDNRPGGGGAIGAQLVAKSAPDGHTLLVGAQGSMALSGLLHKNPPYDPVKDFAPISLLMSTPFTLVVNPSIMPVGSLKDLATRSKAKGGPVPFASGGTGTGMHLAGELFKTLSGADMLHVPYKGNAPAMTDLVGGHVPVAFVDLASATAFIKSGRVKALAVASRTRSQMAPEIPTAAEAGLPGWEAFGWFGLLAPAGTPPEIIDRLNAETVAVLQLPEVRENMLKNGAEPTPTTPEEFRGFIKSEIAKWTRVVRESGAKLE